jgi:hypothetical protein
MGTNDTAHPPGAAAEGPDTDTPMHPDDVTIGPTAHDLGETPEIVKPQLPGRTTAEAEYSVDERRAHGIEDNVRHESGIGRR